MTTRELQAKGSDIPEHSLPSEGEFKILEGSGPCAPASSSLITVATELCDFPSQPRTVYDLEYCGNIAESMKAIGQQVPVIGWFAGGRFQLADGGCRLEAAKIGGISTLLAHDLGRVPTRAEVLMAQAAIDLHKQFLPRIDRAMLYQAALNEKGCTAKQLAVELGASQTDISRHLLLLTLAEDLQEKINAGVLEWTKACLIAQETSDHDRQRELAAEAAVITRDRLAAKLRAGKKPQSNVVKANRIRIDLATGVTVTLAGRALSLDMAIESAFEAHKLMEKGRKEGLSAKTIQTVSADKAGKKVL